MYRLSRSQHQKRFVLKGAMLFSVWMKSGYRPTRDIDLLGSGDDDIDSLKSVLGDICEEPVPDDGLVFDKESIQIEEIREGNAYSGLRAKFVSLLGNARITVQVDVGFGDAIGGESEMIDYPGLLDFPAARLRAYPKEAVIAEKFEAMISLGVANSRMKDFYDIWALSREFAFDGSALAESIQMTFTRRKTEVPRSIPPALSEEFARERGKSAQWDGFLRRADLAAAGVSLNTVISDLAVFLLPPLMVLADNLAFKKLWNPGGPWIDR
ncbi:MAG: nucleotidyl transferase AbiEii/AbiGii toxin family protein [candidate division Zixibacteria bacterium]|nr:nucleotidyl transferase AbiEii/AbiGii toxin family protein [candidate division Zixibacteria bacterium]